MNTMTAESQNQYSRRHFIGSLASGLALSSLPFTSSAANTDHKICIFSKHLQWLAVPEMIENTVALGFDGIDLTVRPGGHVEPAQVATELPRIIKLIRKAGLDVPMITTNIIDPDHELTPIILKTAGELKIPFYRTGYLKYDPSIGVAQGLIKYKTQLQKLAALNQKYNIHGAYQNHAGAGVGAAVWDLWEIIKDLDPRWIGCQYDIKHAVAEGGQSWANGLEIIKSHIKCMDIKDFIWAEKDGKWVNQSVPLGAGMVNYKQYLQLLKKFAISGPMSIHYEYPLGGADSGRNQITIPKEEVLNAMKRDLNTLKSLLNT